MWLLVIKFIGFNDCRLFGASPFGVCVCVEGRRRAQEENGRGKWQFPLTWILFIDFAS